MPILDWLDKEQAVHKAKTVPYRLLKPVRKLSYGDPESENMLIQGDNLDALKALLPLYAGKVKCIFIDPPYNTKSAFEHYDDNLEHSLWLSMMYPRLELLQQLLSEKGSIWVSIDDNESHYLKIIMDEIFGRSNFVRNVIWNKTYTTSNDSKGIPMSHDHIFVYRKTEKFERGLLPRTDKQNSMYKYNDDDGKGRYRTDNLSVKTYSEAYDYPLKNPHTEKEYWPPKGRCWMTSPVRMQAMVDNNEIYFGKDGKGAPQLKRYLDRVQKGVVPPFLWGYEDCGHNDESKKELKKLFENTVFSTPKPEKLIQRILNLATEKGDLVVDSFLGSATTAAVSHKMGRKYIGIEIGEHAETHCQPRLKKVIDGEQGGISESVNWQGGGGFHFYKLGEAIFDEFGVIRPDIRFDELAAHIWYMETRTPLIKKTKTPLLGVHNGKAFYLLYNGILGDRKPQGGNVLTSKILATLPKFDGEKVIYGEATRLGEARLKAENISFRQMPYDVGTH
jgi:adenine-specific DNA-methyltransferase